MRPVRERPEWMTLGEASQLLGVSPGTLRRWSDTGRLRVFTTPGGHRRFNRPSLERLVRGEQPVAALAVRASLTPARLARAYRREARAAARDMPWLLLLTDEQRAWFRAHGRRMAELLLGHLDADAPSAADHLLKEATAEAATYGRMAAELGLSLSQSLEGFLQFRRPFLHELGVAAQRRGADPEAIAVVADRAERALDRLLVAAITAQSVGRVADERRPGRGRLLGQGGPDRDLGTT